MKVAIIRTGRMGSAFAAAFAKRTAPALFIRGSRPDSASAAALSRELGIAQATDKELLAAEVTI
jgi:predicted dinucleotide-binding enzyme